MTAGKSQADKIMSMKGSEKGVIVVGLAKTGNHFFMSLLDALGCDRAEELGVKGGISSIPFEAQVNPDFLQSVMSTLLEFLTIRGKILKSISANGCI